MNLVERINRTRIARTAYCLAALLILAASGRPVAGEDITSNLRGHWKLTETSGTTATDSSPTPHNGTYTNGPTLATSTAVPVDGAISAKFDGANDYVAIPTESFFDITGAITVAAWIKVDVWDVQWQAIVGKGDSSWRLLRDSTNGGVTFACTGTSALRVASTVAVNDGQWHHVVGVYTGSYLIIYVDGIINNYVASTGAVATNNFPVEIARNPEAAGREFDGAIYDVRVYNRALSMADVAYLCLQGGPVGNWELDETTGATADDSSIYDADGTVFGSATWSSRCTGDGLINLNGSTQYISVPSDDHLLPTYALTIAAWINGDAWGSADDADVIVRKGEGNPNNYQLAVVDGRAALMLDDSDTGGIRGNTVLSTGQWYHVAAVWDGSTVKIYVNGVLDNTPASRTGTINYDTRALYIGGRSGADLFDGQMYDVFLYNRALTAAEIAKLAQFVGHWKFAEGAGTSAADSTLSANNATLSGGATWMTDCASNKALLTNGTGGIAATGAAFDPPATGTVAFWMQPAAGTTLRRIVGNGGDWEIRHQADGTLAVDLCGDAGTTSITTEPLNEAGRWYHVAATFNSTTNAYEIYVDGVLDKSGTHAADLVDQPAGVLSFGTRTGSTEYWSGALRDFRVYSRRLCPTEIADLAGLAAYWQLDETSSTTAYDSSPWGRNGTITGTATWNAGKINNALQFNGSTYVGVSGLIGSPKNITLAAWANLTTADSSGAEIISLGDHVSIRLNESGQSKAFFYNGSTWTSVAISQTYAGAGWHHFAAVMDDDNNTFKLYVDGVQAASTSTTNSIVWNGLSGNTSIGRHGNGQTTFDFTGKIDDVRVYNRALCPTQVQELYNFGSGGYQGVRILQWVEVR